MTPTYWTPRFVDRALLIQAAGAIWRRVRGRVRRVFWPVFHRAFGVQFLQNLDPVVPPEGCDVTEYRPGESISIPRPISVGLAPKSFQKKVGTWSIGGPWYAAVSGARLLGPTAVAYTPDNAIVGETVIPENYASRQAGVSLRSLCLSVLPSSRLPTIEAACSMVGPWSKGYFEWVVEFLPRLEALEFYRERSGGPPRIIVDSDPTPWQLESLELLGYPRDDLIVWNGLGARVGSLLVPSFPRRLSEPGRSFSIVSPEALRWVRATILANLPAATGVDGGPRAEKVAISRRYAAGRRVANEEEMMGLLSGLGFVTHVLEDLSFAEQVRLFEAARVVIAPHGAGLANVIFSDELSIIELYGSYFNSSFFTLAAGLGFRYGCLECEPVRTIHPKRDDLRVDLDGLGRLLEAMEVEDLPASGRGPEHRLA